MTTETNTKLPLSTLLEMVQSKEYQDATEYSRIRGFNRGLKIAMREVDSRIGMFENSIRVAKKQLKEEGETGTLKYMYEERIEKFTHTIEMLKDLKKSINSHKEGE